MSLTILPVQPLSEISNYANGKIPKENLVQIGPKGHLTNTAARCWTALWFMAAGLNPGIRLTWTWGGTYRSFASQLSLFLSRYEPCSAARYYATRSSRRKRWRNATANGYSSTFWVKKKINGSYPATAATPAESNHGRAIAIDMAFDDNWENGISPNDAKYIASHPSWYAFKRLVLLAGFSWELQSEKWHIRYVNGDRIPTAVLKVEKYLGYTWKDNVGPIFSDATPTPTEPPVTPTPAPTPPTAPPPSSLNWTETLVKNLPTLKQGSAGDFVRKLQGLLTANRVETTIDGQFGSQTRDKVRWFQGTQRLPITGVIDSATWTALLD